MLRTAGSPTADGKADLEGQQKADQRSLLPGLVYPLRERAQSREQRARRLIGKIRQRPGTFPLHPNARVSRAARSPPDWKDPSTARHLPTAADASSDQFLRSWALALP